MLLLVTLWGPPSRKLAHFLLLCCSTKIRISGILSWFRKCYLTHVILSRECFAMVVLKLTHKWSSSNLIAMLKWRHHVLSHLSVFTNFLELFKDKMWHVMVSKKMNPLFVWGWDRKKLSLPRIAVASLVMPTAIFGTACSIPSSHSWYNLIILPLCVYLCLCSIVSFCLWSAVVIVIDLKHFIKYLPVWVYVTYLFTERVIESCDSPDWLIQYCLSSASSRVTVTVSMKMPCGECFQKCFSAYDMISLWLNTVIPIIVMIWLPKMTRYPHWRIIYRHLTLVSF